LIELLIVVALIAIASGTAVLALRDGASGRLEQDGARLAALLESARTEARASGLPVRFELVASDDAAGDADPAEAPRFRFVGLPATMKMPGRWLDDAIEAEIVGARALRLGPEPLIDAQRIVLRLDNHRLVLATDGLGPFAVESTAAAAAAAP
jgi:general secretion pathway protein H